MPDKCDYKFKYKSFGDKDIKVGFVIYEGSITTEDEPDLNGDMQPVTRYRRTGIVEIKEVTFTKPFNESALHAHMKNLLKEVPDRTPIEEQS